MIAAVGGTRKVIGRRKFHLNQVEAFQADIYLKAVLKTRQTPAKVLGQKVNDGEMGLDTNGKGILYLLEEEKELCPCDLADILGMTVPAVSQHLRKLKDGNIVETRKEAQTIYYSLTKENLKILKPFFKHINERIQKAEAL